MQQQPSDSHTKQQQIRKLAAEVSAEHRALDARLRELEKHISLTAAEQVEYSELKKRKLRAKDRLRLMGVVDLMGGNRS